jgi:hypothetical protein
VNSAAERGTIGAPVAIVLAVEDALKPFNTHIADHAATLARADPESVQKQRVAAVKLRIVMSGSVFALA